MTPRDFFERFLVENFAELTGGKVKEVGAVLQTVITGEGGGTWSMTVKDGKLTVKSEPDKAALAIMHMDATVWRELMARMAPVAGGFKFLFPDPAMVQLIKNSMPGTAEVRLKREGGEPLRMHFGFKECKPESPKTKVTMAFSDWLDLAARKIVPAQLFMAGKATVEGDTALAMNMSMMLA